MPAMRSSLAIRTSWLTAAITSAEGLVRCPRPRVGRRISVWTPPTRWMSRTISAASVSISAITSWITVRTERLTHLVPLLARLLLGSNGCRNSARANDWEKGTLNGVIHPQPAKSDAPRLAIVHPAAGANVARDVILRPRGGEGKLTPEGATGERARQ